MNSTPTRAAAAFLLLLPWLPKWCAAVEATPVMTLECRPPEPVAGEPISIIAWISNPAREPVHLARRSTGVTNEYEVTASYIEIAAPVRKTAFGMFNPLDASTRIRDLPPGKTITEVIPVSRLLDMTLPAEYRIKVTRRRVFVGEKPVSLSAEIVIDVKRPPSVPRRVTDETPPPRTAPLPPPPSAEEVRRARTNWMLSGLPVPTGTEPMPGKFWRPPAPRWPLALGSGLGGLVIGFALAALVFRRRVMQAALLASKEEGT